MGIRTLLKKSQLVRDSYSLSRASRSFFVFKPILFFKQYLWFAKQYSLFRASEANQQFQQREWFPCLFDNIGYTPMDPTYFFQDTWVAKKLFDLKPNQHVDVGSSATTMGILSQYCPLIMVDIRPPKLKLPNLTFVKGSILNLPFDDGSIDSISSLCVVEHIGLGRYGDDIDPFGSEKAFTELQRVVRPGGRIFISIPVDKCNKIYFNAHRAFTHTYLMELFSGFELLENKFHYDDTMHDTYDEQKEFGTGLYMFKKMS